MRVMLDTNVLVSALLYPSAAMDQLLEVLDNDQLVLSDYVIDELMEVVQRKAPTRLDGAHGLLRDLRFEIIDDEAEGVAPTALVDRDVNDVPVLLGAIAADVDILVTGDKDFSELGLDRPLILTPSQYVAFRTGQA